jgi:uncharacterized protein (DUF2384 family)
MRRRHTDQRMSGDQNVQMFVVFELDGTPVGVFHNEEEAKNFIAETSEERGPFLAFLEVPFLGEML